MFQEQLNSLAEDLIYSYPYIDHGGCCVVAVRMANHLQSNAMQVRIRSAQSWKRPLNLDTARKKIQAGPWASHPGHGPLEKSEWLDQGVDYSHVWVEFKLGRRWYAFDSTRGCMPAKEFVQRMVKRRGWKPNKGTFTVEEAASFAAEASWNPEFNRRQIPGVHKKIDQFFKQLSVLFA